MKQYLDLLQDILDNGSDRTDRTGIGTRSVFGRQIRFNLHNGFPAVTTKKLAWKGVVSELLFFLSGSTNEHRLAEIKNDNTPYTELTDKQKRTIWTDNYESQGKALGYTNGEMGPIYSKQYRCFEGVDQVSNVIEQIKNNPDSRRLLVSAWNPKDIPSAVLPPCHVLYQFYVDDVNISLMWYQRSVDTMLGLPFNIASYALLLHIVARMTNKIPHELIGSLGDTHIYTNHMEQVKEQLTRTPHKLPTLRMPEIDYANMTIDEVLSNVKTSDFVLENYECDGIIKAKMAV